jgi:hypothetical protein
VDSFALGVTPDSVQGYGEVNLLSAIPATSSDNSAQDLYVMDALAVVGKKNYILELNVASSDKPLKVTIVSCSPFLPFLLDLTLLVFSSPRYEGLVRSSVRHWLLL